MNTLGCSADALLIDETVSGLPTILKSQLERISSLEEYDQKAIIHVIDNYTNAVAYNNMLEGKTILGQRPLLGKTKNVIK